LRSFLWKFFGRAKQALYLSHTKTTSNGTKPANMMITHAPASGPALEKYINIMHQYVAVVFCLLLGGINLSGQIQVVNPDSTHIKGRNIEYFDGTSIPSDKALYVWV
jgi:hypothetical protein